MGGSYLPIIKSTGGVPHKVPLSRETRIVNQIHLNFAVNWTVLRNHTTLVLIMLRLILIGDPLMTWSSLYVLFRPRQILFALLNVSNSTYNVLISHRGGSTSFILGDSMEIKINLTCFIFPSYYILCSTRPFSHLVSHVHNLTVTISHKGARLISIFNSPTPLTNN